MSKELVPLAACADSKQRKSKGVSKTMVVMSLNKKGTYRHPLATIYLQSQDCRGKACYPREFVPLAACAESKKSPGMKVPIQRVVLCANKW